MSMFLKPTKHAKPCVTISCSDLSSDSSQPIAVDTNVPDYLRWSTASATQPHIDAHRNSGQLTSTQSLEDSANDAGQQMSYRGRQQQRKKMAAVGFPMLLAAYIFLILPRFSSCGLPEYGTTDFGQFLDPVGMALKTAHDVRVRHFGLQKLHSCFVPGQCPDVPAAASPAGMAGGRKWLRHAVTCAILSIRHHVVDVMWRCAFESRPSQLETSVRILF